MLQKVAFTMYPVIDINRAKSFYENNLGLVPSKSTEDGGWIEYDLPGGGCFAITTYVPNLLPNLHAGARIAFEVEDLDTLVSNLKSNNVQFKLDIVETPVCRMAVMIDSEGNGIILHQLNK